MNASDDVIDEWKELYSNPDVKDAERLAEFIVQAEAGEYDADMYIDETVRLARSLLNESDVDATDAVLGQWTPKTDAVDEHTARTQTRRAVEWLQEGDAAHGRQAFVNALSDGTTLSTESWWTDAVQPGLDRFNAVGIVALSADGTYLWMGDATVDHNRDDEPENAGVPNSDPRHVDPAGDLAHAVESGELELTPDDYQDAEELRAFLDTVEQGEIDADPRIEAMARIVRSILEDAENESDES